MPLLNEAGLPVLIPQLCAIRSTTRLPMRRPGDHNIVSLADASNDVKTDETIKFSFINVLSFVSVNE